MTDLDAVSVAVTIIANDPPFAHSHGVLFGLQSKRAVDDPVPATVTSTFHTDLEVRIGGGADVDFAGVHVHGRRDDRFLYLTWGVPDPSEPFVMFARAKIELNDIPIELLDRCIEEHQSLVAELDATNPKGQPASGTIRAPGIHWTLG